MGVRVFICGDDLLLCAGLRALLNGQSDLTVVGDAATAEDSLRLVRELTPDVVLVCGSAFPDDVHRELAENSRTVVLADLGTVESAARTVSFGARALLSPKVSESELMQAIRMVAAGDLVLLPAELTRHITQMLRDAAPPRQPTGPTHGLTLREAEVLRLLSQGLSNADIAQKLCISETTVRSHVHRMLGKLAVRSRAQAVAVAYESGLIPT
jgi:DNA-binding NarL/FixJ family response regulator